jgi:hypothetical protein
MDPSDIPAELEAKHWQACGLECPVMNGGTCLNKQGQMCTGAKFENAAAEILHSWSLDSGQDEECGHSEFGNGWHALFREDRCILYTNSQGFVGAMQFDTTDEMEKVWAECEEGAVYPDDED